VVHPKEVSSSLSVSVSPPRDIAVDLHIKVRLLKNAGKQAKYMHEHFKQQTEGEFHINLQCFSFHRLATLMQKLYDGRKIYVFRLSI
jgi:hypothetical protein